MEWKVRLGNNINFKWPILTSGQPVPLEGRNLTLVVTDPASKEFEIDFYVEGNIVITSLLGKYQTLPGRYTFTLWENRGLASQAVVDLCAPFLVVRHSHESNVKPGVAMTMPSGELFTALKGDTGLSAYEVAVKNGFEGTEEEWLDSLKSVFRQLANEVKEGDEWPITSHAVWYALQEYQKLEHLILTLWGAEKSIEGEASTIYYKLQYFNDLVQADKLELAVGDGEYEEVEATGQITYDGFYPAELHIRATYGAYVTEAKKEIKEGNPIYYGVVAKDYEPSAESIVEMDTTLLPFVHEFTLDEEKVLFAVPREESITGIFDENDLNVTKLFSMSGINLNEKQYYLFLMKEEANVADFGINLQGVDSSAIYGLLSNKILQLEDDPIIWTDEEAG